MTRPILAALAFILTITLTTPAGAHEVRPAYLAITQTGKSSWHITWKQPSQGSRALHLVPHLSNGWLEQSPDDQYAAAGFVIRTWDISDPGSSLAGQRLAIEGLSDSITDVYLQVQLEHHQHLQAIITPDSPEMTISLENGKGMGAWAFVWLGIKHILSGPDHLSFVLGLVLIVRNRMMLLKTISAFTLAHSITLAATSLGLIAASDNLLNALIGLSILFLAPEVIRARQGGTSLAIRYPWVVAFGFGLIHGMGFASGLATLGLDRSQLLEALVFFNLGVEVGQLLFIGAILSIMWLARSAPASLPRFAERTTTYAIGSLGAMWTLQYSAEFFSGGWQP